MLPPSPWKAEPLLTFCAVLLIALGALGAALSLAARAAGAAPDGPTPPWLLAAGTLAMQGVILGGLVWLARAHRLPWGGAFAFGGPRPGRALGWGALTGLLFVPLAWGAQEFAVRGLTLLDVPVPEQRLVEALRGASAPALLALHALGAVLLAPLVEEHVFRGVLYRSLAARGGRLLGLAASAALFAASHANLRTAAPLFLLGVLWALLYERTADLLAPVASHAVFNAVNFAFILRGEA
jgi:membrane protease YdiL (CAAX protease family)